MPWRIAGTASAGLGDIGDVVKWFTAAIRGKAGCWCEVGARAHNPCLKVQFFPPSHTNGGRRLS